MLLELRENKSITFYEMTRPALVAVNLNFDFRMNESFINGFWRNRMEVLASYQNGKLTPFKSVDIGNL